MSFDLNSQICTPRVLGRCRKAQVIIYRQGVFTFKCVTVVISAFQNDVVSLKYLAGEPRVFAYVPISVFARIRQIILGR